ncbi:unnamed protein product [Didymodactylos carnosus]|uniref:Uncharacterized protein n=1 Tax=Didymodactylos carnosus TaxID=1234261 RepID=A0A815EEL6_9BILA|nr:unnamed protein product [Didymodactylos carnosus]CAF1309367.1 unnamed protein product [Didymodactylos carnosus]CAF3781204.1 unnamed protein product [Didymodactylos carnosus]CAF4145548.1 unnamed protein product [Didymodactylos carnosus]
MNTLTCPNNAITALPQFYNNIGTSDTNHTANFDGDSNSYSAQALAAVNITPGATIQHNGVHFVWPSSAPGTNNNVQANGQVINTTGTTGCTLGFLGAGTNGPQNGAIMVTYNDSATQTFQLTLNDWFFNTPSDGTDILATTLLNKCANAFVINPTKTIQTITLPVREKLHIFAIGTTCLPGGLKCTSNAASTALSQFYNNIGTSDTNHTADFDGTHDSYSAQALAAVNITPGATIQHNGVYFVWPSSAPGTNNNVKANGQVINTTGLMGCTLGFLGAGAPGEQGGSVIVTYNDSATQTFRLTFNDWYSNSPASGTDILATTTWNTCSNGVCTPGNHQVSIYYSGFAINPTKTIQTITLPVNTNLHIFAIGTTCLPGS